MKKTQRSQRLAELIRRCLAKILLAYKYNYYLNQITITEVDVAVDLSIAKVFFTVFNDKDIKSATKELKFESKHLRHLLAQELNLRITPRLTFYYDSSIEQARKLDDLINTAVSREQ